MLFQDIINQYNTKANLIASVKNNRITHAQLFAGPQGSGKLPLAIAYAQYVNCEEKGAEDSCGKCPSCLKYQKLAHPDLHFVFPVVSQSNKSSISDDFIHLWRELLHEKLYFTENEWYKKIGVENKQGFIGKQESYAILRKLAFKNFEAKYKVVIVWLPEKMNQAAANKLLKILEEPPPQTLFILVSDDAESLLPTIRSRLQLVPVPKIQNDELEKALIERFYLNNEEARHLANISKGNVTQVISLMENEEGEVYFFEQFVEWMRLCYKIDIASLLEWIETIVFKGREEQKYFLQYALRLIRANYFRNLGISDIAYLRPTEEKFSRNFALFIRSDNISGLYEELNKTSNDIEANANPKIVFLDLSLKIMKLLKKRNFH